jgi:hypothetical protein
MMLLVTVRGLSQSQDYARNFDDLEPVAHSLPCLYAVASVLVYTSGVYYSTVQHGHAQFR